MLHIRCQVPNKTQLQLSGLPGCNTLLLKSKAFCEMSVSKNTEMQILLCGTNLCCLSTPEGLCDETNKLDFVIMAKGQSDFIGYISYSCNDTGHWVCGVLDSFQWCQHEVGCCVLWIVWQGSGMFWYIYIKRRTERLLDLDFRLDLKQVWFHLRVSFSTLPSSTVSVLIVQSLILLCLRADKPGCFLLYLFHNRFFSLMALWPMLHLPCNIPSCGSDCACWLCLLSFICIPLKQSCSSGH